MFYIFGWILWAVVIGLIAKALHPGKDPTGLFPTIGIGILGSFLGGVIGWILGWGNFFETGGILTSIAGGVIVCFAYRKYQEYQEKNKQ